MKKDLAGGRRLERLESGLTVNIKKLLPKGAKLPCPPCPMFSLKINSLRKRG